MKYFVWFLDRVKDRIEKRVNKLRRYMEYHLDGDGRERVISTIILYMVLFFVIGFISGGLLFFNAIFWGLI